MCPLLAITTVQSVPITYHYCSTERSVPITYHFCVTECAHILPLWQYRVCPYLTITAVQSVAVYYYYGGGTECVRKYQLRRYSVCHLV